MSFQFFQIAVDLGFLVVCSYNLWDCGKTLRKIIGAGIQSFIAPMIGFLILLGAAFCFFGWHAIYTAGLILDGM